MPVTPASNEHSGRRDRSGVADDDLTARDARAWGWLTAGRQLLSQPGVGALLVATVLIVSGEQLWIRMMPEYLRSLGASAAVLGIYGMLAHTVHVLYQYPSGWLSDRFGQRHALFGLTAMALAGYLLYLIAPGWPVVLVGTLLVGQSWTSLTLPAMFSALGQQLTRSRRLAGVGLQALCERLPMTVMPVLGGLLIAGTAGSGGHTGGGGQRDSQAAAGAATGGHGVLGLSAGMRAGFAVTIVFALIALVVLVRRYPKHDPVDQRRGWRRHSHAPWAVWSSWPAMTAKLRRLLLADTLVQWGQQLTHVFVVLYVRDVVHVSLGRYGLLVGLSEAVAMTMLLPGALAARRYGRVPLVLTGFALTAASLLVLAAVPTLLGAVVAFTLTGLSQLGEPARRTLVIEGTRELGQRGRVVGLYHLVQGAAVVPAPLVGAALWSLNYRAPFVVAGLVAAAGGGLYATRRHRVGR